MSRPIALCAGSYQVELDARVAEGGMSIGLLNETQSAFLGSTKLSHRVQTSPTNSAPIVVPSNQAVYVVLSNWRGVAKPSLWSIRPVKIFRLDGESSTRCG